MSQDALKTVLRKHSSPSDVHTARHLSAWCKLLLSIFENSLKRPDFSICIEGRNAQRIVRFIESDIVDLNILFFKIGMFQKRTWRADELKLLLARFRNSFPSFFSLLLSCFQRLRRCCT